jgi:hypothetical protein
MIRFTDKDGRLVFIGDPKQFPLNVSVDTVEREKEYRIFVNYVKDPVTKEKTGIIRGMNMG